MEKGVRCSETPPLPERGFTLSPALDANLRDRVRALLVSRNQHTPPKTPCPTPDYNHIPRGSEENRSSQSTTRKKEYTFSPALAIRELSRLEDIKLDMGITRFDGPAGQFQDDSNKPSSRRLSQPRIHTERQLSGDWPRPTQVPGLNQRVQGEMLARETSLPKSSKSVKSSASKKSTGSQVPRFHLRTVPPAVNVNKVVRSTAQHVPGSYQSELLARNERSSETISTLRDDIPDFAGENVIALPTDHHAGRKDEPSRKAVETLKDLAKHNHNEVNSPTPKARASLSKETLKSTVPIRQSPDPLWRPVTSYVGRDEVVQSEARPVADPGQPHDALADTQAFIIGDTDDEKADGVIALPERRVSPTGIGETAINHDNQQSSAGTLPALDTAFLNQTARSVSSSHSIPLDKDEDIMKPVTPLLTNAPHFDVLVEEEKLDDATAPLIPGTRRSSRNTAKASPISRALSILSELSSRSMISGSSFGSSTKDKRRDSYSHLTRKPNSNFNRIATNVERSSSIYTPAKRKYKALADDEEKRQIGASNSTDGTLLLRQHSTNGESFTRVITDLESLLKEALNIAGQANSKDQNETKPYASRVRPATYNRVVSDTSSDSSGYQVSLSEMADEEDNKTTLPKGGHRQSLDRALIKESKNDAFYEGNSLKALEANPSTLPAKNLPSLPRMGFGEPDINFNSKNLDILSVPTISPQTSNVDQEPPRHQAFNSADWAVLRVPSQPSKLRQGVKSPSPTPKRPSSILTPAKEQHTFLVREHGNLEDDLTRNNIREYVNAKQRPPIQLRMSSMRLRAIAKRTSGAIHEEHELHDMKAADDDGSDCDCIPYVADFKPSGLNYHPVFQATLPGESSQTPGKGPFPFHPREATNPSLHYSHEHPKQDAAHQDDLPVTNTYSLEGRHHFSVREPRGFSLSRSHRRSPIARDWSIVRKRFSATVACITTAFIGLIIGIYAGEVPAIQYAIADEHHYTILGNVFFFIGLAITTGLFYPLPLLHGRKPYTLAALAILLPLQFPQALAIDSPRTPYIATYRVGLLVPRVFAGIVMGFASINLITTLLDLFGASLQSGNPHQETVNENDVRRHGGGMGVWLGIWTWCFIGSIGVGFLIGACIISGLNVSWGFWILIILNAAVLVLNILSPEVRRSAYRRSMAEVRNGDEVSRRVARGEIKMHLQSTGPVWWWEEVWAGHVLAIRMLKQPGFAVLALYIGWIYAQVVLVIVVRS